MKIEDMNPESLGKAPDKELYSLRLRFVQLFNKFFFGNNREKANSLERKDMLSKYRILIKEMNTRDLRTMKETNIDRAVFKNAMLGVDVPSMGEFVVVENYISIGGSFVKDPKGAEDVDVIIRDQSASRDEGLELKIGRTIRTKTKKDPHFVYSPKGPHSSYIPLFDLVLRNRSETKKVEVKEALAKIEKQSQEYFAQLDNWDEILLRDNYEVIKALDQGSVLDLGCGTGRLLKLLEQSGRQVEGVDKNDIALGFCKKKGLTVHKLDLEDGTLPFEDASFDNVISVHALEHLTNIEPMVKEAKRVGRKKVILLIPLGQRWDKTHKQKFDTIDDLEKTLGSGWKMKEIKDTDSALASCRVLEKKTLKPLQRFVPLKMGRGYAMGEQFDIEEMWDKWAKAYVDRGIPLAVQKKFSGWRVVLQLGGEDKTLIYFEDSKKDRSKQFPDLTAELKTIKKPVILDAELEALTPGGDPIPRKDLAYWGDNPTVPREFETPGGVKGRYICNVFDILYCEGEDLHDREYRDRREQLKKLFGAFDFKLLKMVPEIVVKSKDEFVKAIKKVSDLPGSEGAVVKTVTGNYPLTGQSPTWAKIKTIVEFKVQVLEQIPVKDKDTYVYRIGYLSDGEIKEMGKTYNTKMKASKGDILTISAQEIIPKVGKDGKLEISAIAPGVRDKDISRKKPETAKEIASRANRAGILQVTPDQEKDLRSQGLIKQDEGVGGEFGNIDFTEGMKGTGVLQAHIMGIEEENIERLRQGWDRIKVARGDPRKLGSVLKSILGEQGVHLDIRLRPSGKDYWEGGEFMVGNISGLPKMAEAKTGRKLRFAWKQSRVGEKKTKIVRGPLSWMDVGWNKIEIMAPGEVGATANLHAAIVTLDKFKWEIYQADEHAKKFRFSDRIIDGNWLFAFVPVGEGKRVWMASLLDPDDHTKPKPVEKLSPAQRKECDAETEKIRESAKTAVFPHKFKPAKYTHKNGHPRCLICGDEERIGGICRKGAFFKFLKVDKKQQIVGGIVYAPGEEDSQGDYTDKKEIEKAMYRFMEKYSKDSKRIKVMHKGETKHFPILECFQPDADIKKGGQEIKAGSWWLMIKVPDKEIWKLVENGSLTGFSMGGQAWA
jgi:SAM-dependent methyltransferase